MILDKSIQVGFQEGSSYVSVCVCVDASVWETDNAFPFLSHKLRSTNTALP